MPSKYAEVHKPENLAGPGDARPTALQIIEDEGLVNKMTDKVFLVTGASAGIGIETGRALAATGGKVFLTVRDMKKGAEACKSFLEPGRVELLEMDNTSLESVRSAAKAFLGKSDRLNVLVNNAGIMATPYEITKDGFESQFETNHLAHFLLFGLLKDTLIKSSTPEFHSRVVNVSSSGHSKYFEFFSALDISYTLSPVRSLLPKHLLLNRPCCSLLLHFSASFPYILGGSMLKNFMNSVRRSPILKLQLHSRNLRSLGRLCPIQERQHLHGQRD